jgi:hypothetical protein
MRPRRASRRVSRELGEVFVSSLHLHNLPLVQVFVGTEPLELSSLFFPFLPLPVYPKSRSSLNLLPSTRHQPQKDALAFPSLLNNCSPHHL